MELMAEMSLANGAVENAAALRRAGGGGSTWANEAENKADEAWAMNLSLRVEHGEKHWVSGEMRRRWC